MRAKNLDDVAVYRKALDAADVISAILARPVFNKELDLKDQLMRSTSRVGPLIAEGFGQLTDRHLLVYLGRARGSVLETLGHLRTALTKGFISSSEHLEAVETYDHIGRMLSRWISYLQDTDWKDRG